MNQFSKKVASKSDSELTAIAENPNDYQDEFLEAVRLELEKRQTDFESGALLERLEMVSKVKELKEYQGKVIVDLPSSLKWSANLIYIAVILRFVDMVRFNIQFEVNEVDLSYIMVLLNFGLMIFIASTIRKGRDIRKLMLIVVLLSIFPIFISVLFFINTGGQIVLSASFVATLIEIITVILLYHDDSREWYENEGRKF